MSPLDERSLLPGRLLRKPGGPKRVDGFQGVQIDGPRLAKVLAPEAPLIVLYEGTLHGEGPIWYPKRERLFWSDVPNRRLLEWHPDGQVTVAIDATFFMNGNAIDAQGRLVHPGRYAVLHLAHRPWAFGLRRGSSRPAAALRLRRAAAMVRAAWARTMRRGRLGARDPRHAGRHRDFERWRACGLRRTKAKADGPNEGAFLPCSCWMADCLGLRERHDEAAAQFERVLAVSNDVGLLSEEYNVPAKHLAGNFPQVLTHLAVVNTALGLSGNVLHRGGG